MQLQQRPSVLTTHEITVTYNYGNNEFLITTAQCVALINSYIASTHPLVVLPLLNGPFDRNRVVRVKI